LDYYRRNATDFHVREFLRDIGCFE
ncbi:MAG: hypothetical protein QG656_571, partial [Candidatus Hydrogenedentes bacterium]|nr:hypothetical protein [Candidatus Hydrogenedentota bacterium]